MGKSTRKRIAKSNYGIRSRRDEATSTTGGKGNTKVQIYEHLGKEAFTVAWSPDGCKSQL
jgi:hypothetical protein